MVGKESLTYKEKKTIVEMSKAALDVMDNRMTDDEKRHMIDTMKEHGDLDEYAIYGHLIAILITHIIDDLKGDDGEYKIVG